MKGLERGREQVRTKEKRERRETCEMEKIRKKEWDRVRKDSLIEEYYKIIIFIRFELQWAVIDSSLL